MRFQPSRAGALAAPEGSVHEAQRRRRRERRVPFVPLRRLLASFCCGRGAVQRGTLPTPPGGGGGGGGELPRPAQRGRHHPRLVLIQLPAVLPAVPRNSRTIGVLLLTARRLARTGGCGDRGGGGGGGPQQAVQERRATRQIFQLADILQHVQLTARLGAADGVHFARSEGLERLRGGGEQLDLHHALRVGRVPHRGHCHHPRSARPVADGAGQGGGVEPRGGAEQPEVAFGVCALGAGLQPAVEGEYEHPGLGPVGVLLAWVVVTVVVRVAPLRLLVLSPELRVVVVQHLPGQAGG
eukprot:1196148-Prorocentrum_minimum.AAC.5